MVATTDQPTDAATDRPGDGTGFAPRRPRERRGATTARRRPALLRPAPSRADVVQSVERQRVDVPRRRGESLAVFSVFAITYTVVGYWLVVDKHVVGFETLDRFSRALVVVHDGSPRLAAVGYDYPPLVVVLLVPLLVVPAAVTTLAVVPLGSAVFAGATMVALDTTMRRAEVTGPLRVLLLAAVGLNPLVVLHASVGSRSFVWLAFAVAALGALFAWYVTAELRFVMVAGIAFAAASLAGYSSLVWFLVAAAAVVAILSRLGADAAEVEGTAVGFGLPTVLAVGLWTTVNAVLVGDPLHWVPDQGVRSSGDLGWLDVLRGSAELVVRGAPIALLVLPALLVAGLRHRNAFARWLGVLLGATILLPGAAAALGLDDAPLTPADALPVLMVSVVGGLWLARSAPGGSNPVAAALAVGLLLSIPWTFAGMDSFERQGLEGAFHDAVLTGDSQEGARTPSGAVVGYADERLMADYVLEHVDGRDAVLTDDRQTFAVVLLTGRPDLFLGRAGTSGDTWDDAAASPAGRVEYLLLAANGGPTGADVLARLYPDAAAGDDPALRTVYATSRYVLVEVPAGYRPGPPDQPAARSTGAAR